MSVIVYGDDTLEFEIREDYAVNSQYFDTYRSSVDKGMKITDKFNIPFNSQQLELINSDPSTLTLPHLLDLYQVNEFFGYVDHSVTTLITRSWYMGKDVDRDLILYIIKTNEVAAAIIYALNLDYIFPIHDDLVDNRVFYTKILNKLDQLLPLVEVINNIEVIDRYDCLSTIEFVELHIDNPDIDVITNNDIQAMVAVCRINRGEIKPLVKIFHNNFKVDSMKIVLRNLRVTEHNPIQRVKDIISSYRKIEGLNIYKELSMNTDPEVTDLLVEWIQAGLSEKHINKITMHGHTELILRLHRLDIISIAEWKTKNSKSFVEVHKLRGKECNPINVNTLKYIVKNHHLNLITSDILYDCLLQTEDLRPIYTLIAENRVDVIRLIPLELVYHLNVLLCARLIKMGARMSLRPGYSRSITKEMMNFFIENGYQIEEYPTWLFSAIQNGVITTDAILIIRSMLTEDSVAIKRLDEIMELDRTNYVGINRRMLRASLVNEINSLMPEALKIEQINGRSLTDIEDNDEDGLDLVAPVGNRRRRNVVINDSGSDDENQDAGTDTSGGILSDYSDNDEFNEAYYDAFDHQ